MAMDHSFISARMGNNGGERAPTAFLYKMSDDEFASRLLRMIYNDTKGKRGHLFLSGRG